MAQLPVKPVIFYIKSKKKPSVMMIPTIDEITVKNGNSYEKKVIRYCVGEKSVFKDDQSEHAKQAKSISVRNGALFVSPYESTLLEYLRLSDRNGSNENRNPEREVLYYENKAEEKAAKSLAEEKNEIEARFKVFQLELEEVKAFCSALNLCNPDEKSDDEMRHTMLLYSKQSPTKFIDAINNMPKMKRAYHVNTALSYKVIERRGQSIFWKNGELILTAPLNTDAVDFFIEKSWTEYKAEYDQILKSLFPKKEFTSSAPETTSKTEGKQVEKQNTSKMISLAIDNGVIKWDRKMKTYITEIDGEPKELGASINDVEKCILENEELFGIITKNS